MTPRRDAHSPAAPGFGPSPPKGTYAKPASSLSRRPTAAPPRERGPALRIESYACVPPPDKPEPHATQLKAIPYPVLFSINRLRPPLVSGSMKNGANLFSSLSGFSPVRDGFLSGAALSRQRCRPRGTAPSWRPDVLLRTVPMGRDAPWWGRGNIGNTGLSNRGGGAGRGRRRSGERGRRPVRAGPQPATSGPRRRRPRRWRGWARLVPRRRGP